MNYVLCSTNPARADLPRVSYWNAADRAWVAYDAATRYDHTPDALPVGEHRDATVELIAALGEDLYGFPWLTDRWLGPVRMTHCCAAATSVSDGPLYCKSCYEAVTWDYEDAPVLGPVGRR